jgi:hypothetical protein
MIGDQKGCIKCITTEIKKIIRDYSEELYRNEQENLEVIHNLWTHAA